MFMSSSRREFLAGVGALSLFEAVPRLSHASAGCPFRLSVISDEISPDFDHACSVAAKDFGLHWIEIRSMWGKKVTELTADEIDQSRKILGKYQLAVTDIASSLFKVHWPGAPLSKKGPRRDEFQSNFDFKQQDEVLARCIDLCKVFETNRIRCFDFWRLENPGPYRAAINDKLRQAARICAEHNLILLLENEPACNTGSGREAAETLAAIEEPNFMLNWDPGNSATFAGDVPYPDDYKLLPNRRIGHCHCKDTIRKPDGKFDWAPVGGGIVDWVGQFRAFERDGYHYAVSLETHWHGGGTLEASSRISMKGLKNDLVKAGINCRPVNG
jgi:L-ribulose-5-phosphate 3-epimerase